MNLSARSWKSAIIPLRAHGFAQRATVRNLPSASRSRRGKIPRMPLARGSQMCFARSKVKVDFDTTVSKSARDLKSSRSSIAVAMLKAGSSLVNSAPVKDVIRSLICGWQAATIQVIGSDSVKIGGGEGFEGGEMVAGISMGWPSGPFNRLVPLRWRVRSDASARLARFFGEAGAEIWDPPPGSGGIPPPVSGGILEGRGEGAPVVVCIKESP